ncbi:hypothetical protein [Sporisorium scitamineum]|uniref:Uncharacterized protein n=1 Tax=Sporisorium scitamineum TaxID=49012 RepID=A0A0F7RW85_9BASI|nr:hypothetical protein [Sporisorium scitamineum]
MKERGSQWVKARKEFNTIALQKGFAERTTDAMKIKFNELRKKREEQVAANTRASGIVENTTEIDQLLDEYIESQEHSIHVHQLDTPISITVASNVSLLSSMYAKRKCRILAGAPVIVRMSFTFLPDASNWANASREMTQAGMLPRREGGKGRGRRQERAVCQPAAEAKRREVGRNKPRFWG